MFMLIISQKLDPYDQYDNFTDSQHLPIIFW